jgi:hypothetical protein
MEVVCLAGGVPTGVSRSSGETFPEMRITPMNAEKARDMFDLRQPFAGETLFQKCWVPLPRSSAKSAFQERCFLRAESKPKEARSRSSAWPEVAGFRSVTYVCRVFPTLRTR